MWAFAEDVPVREAAQEGAKKVRALKYGEKVGVVADEGEWIKIGDGQYVARKHLTDRKSSWGKRGAKPKTPAKAPPKKKK